MLTAALGVTHLFAHGSLERPRDILIPLFDVSLL